MGESKTLAAEGMGLTERQREALLAITAHVGRHGVMPSRSMLAAEIGCSKNNANRLMQVLVERGELSSLARGGPVTGFGRDGVAVFLPPDVVAHLAQYCAIAGEKLQHVVADAIALHLDQVEGAVE